MQSQLDYVLEQLRQRKQSYRVIGKGSGIDHNTVRYIAIGHTPNPGVKTVEALARYFKSHEM